MSKEINILYLELVVILNFFQKILFIYDVENHRPGRLSRTLVEKAVVVLLANCKYPPNSL